MNDTHSILSTSGKEPSDEKRIGAENELRKLNFALLRQTALLEATNEELKAFSYSVSHDLRAPLRSINGFSQALMEDYANQLDARGKDYLTRIHNAADRMSRLMDDLAKLSRLTRNELRLESVDLSALARFVVEDLRQRDPGRVVEVVIEDQMVVSADGSLMHIVIENLLGNAWKFTSNQARARIEFGRCSLEAASMPKAPTPDTGTAPEVFYIHDNGAGFDMTYADRLFGAFQRLHSTEEFPGTGIGLATVRRIITRHGGKIWARGDPGNGATFYFVISPWTQPPEKSDR